MSKEAPDQVDEIVQGLKERYGWRIAGAVTVFSLAILATVFGAGQVFASYHAQMQTYNGHLENISRHIEDEGAQRRVLERRVTLLEKARISDSWNTYRICTAIAPPGGCTPPNNPNPGE